MALFNCGRDCEFGNPSKEHLLHHIKNGIPTKINYSQIRMMPTRDDFLNPVLKRAFDSQSRNGHPLLFMPNSVVEKNDWEDGTMVYKVYLFGILPCGSKTCVKLENIKVYFDIMVPLDSTPQKFEDYICGMFINRGISFNGVSNIQKYRLHGFQKKPRIYKRFTFSNMQERKKAIEYIMALNKGFFAQKKPIYETASDDLGQYYPLVAREYRFNTADWNRITDYELLDPNTTTNCKYVISVDINNYKRLTRQKRDELMSANNIISQVINRDLTQVCMWDIETYRTIQNGMVPTVDDDDFVIFMMCTAFFWHHSNKQMLDVCVVDKATNAREGVLVTIVCETESNVLNAHMEVISKMAPDILGAFNGGNFDWPLYREKLRREEKLVLLKSKLSSLPTITTGHRAEREDSVLKWNFASPRIKIDAETNHTLTCVANFPGILDTDVLPVFLKLYPKMEVRSAFSLNFFLQKNNLESKADMPYKRMFKIYERACKLSTAPKDCHCGDAQTTCTLCNEHVKEVDYIQAENEIEPEYTKELHPDLLHVVGGETVEKCCCCGKRKRNLTDMADVGYYCIIDCVRPQQLYVKQTIVSDKRGLSNMTYVSLYDSFYRADGMKVRNIIGKYCSKKGIAFSNARTLKSESDKDHYPGAWVFPPIRGLNNKRPITGLDFASLYPSLMMTYNLSPDMIVTTKEEADELAAAGYSLHHIERFEYERGDKKGNASNQKLSIEGWAVRHSGIFNPDKDKSTVAEYVKWITIEHPGGAIKFKANPGPDDEQRKQILNLQSNGVAIKRVVSYIPTEGREALPGERMGIAPYVVKKIFDKRVPIKKEFVRLSSIKSAMEKNKLTDSPEYADIEFNTNKINSTQKALKILSNTFYGESGNYMSPIYELLVAAGITCAGQMNIKRVDRFVRSKGFEAQYGDTDSLYLTCPDRIYAELDAQYEQALARIKNKYENSDDQSQFTAEKTQARLEYWEAMVRLTMKVMSELTEDVSDFLLGDNGTRFLNMAYEEVGFPTVLCGKKKYFMIPHEDDVNFYPKDLFIRGIEIIKQGQTPIAKMLGEEFMREALSPENERELIDIAEDKIRKFYQTNQDPMLFVSSAKYRPNKKNVKVQTFVKRMVDAYEKHKHDPIMSALYEPPEAGDKFQFVLVKKDMRYTLQGKKIELKKGDKMEFLRVYRASQSTPNPMKLDLDDYVKGSIIGLFARFIAYHPKFQPPENTYDVSDKEQYKAMDAYCVNKATKHLEQLCDSITGYDHDATLKRGRNYRSIYHYADKQLRRDAVSRFGGAAFVLHKLNIHDDESDDNRAISTKIIDQLREYARGMAEIETNAGEHYLKINESKGKFGIFALRRAYNSDRERNISRTRVDLCNRAEEGIVEKLYNVIPKAFQIISKYENKIIDLIEDMRKIKYTSEIQIDDEDLENINNLSAEESEVIYQVHKHLIELAAVYRTKSNVLSIVSAIELAKARATNEPLDPKIDTFSTAIAEARRAKPLPDYNWA